MIHAVCSSFFWLLVGARSCSNNCSLLYISNQEEELQVANRKDNKAMEAPAVLEESRTPLGGWWDLVATYRSACKPTYNSGRYTAS